MTLHLFVHDVIGHDARRIAHNHAAKLAFEHACRVEIGYGVAGEEVVDAFVNVHHHLGICRTAQRVSVVEAGGLGCHVDVLERIDREIDIAAVVVQAVDSGRRRRGAFSLKCPVGIDLQRVEGIPVAALVHGFQDHVTVFGTFNRATHAPRGLACARREREYRRRSDSRKKYLVESFHRSY